MTLPDLSNSMYVARLRYIQTIHESPELRNPDTLVWYFTPVWERVRTAWLGRNRLSKLRADPFYYYVVARTKYYDQVMNDAIADGVQQVISVGCGSDTRPYRFDDLLCSRSVRVLECDQAEAILAKRRMVQSLKASQHVEYLPVDLNDGQWPHLEQWLECRPAVKTLVMMEGVSPYINESAFSRFLLLMSSTLSFGSHVAYDFKVRGIKKDFGVSKRTQTPFRLPQVKGEIATFHEEYGFAVEGIDWSAELSERLLPCLARSGSPLFTEDGLVRLTVKRS